MYLAVVLFDAFALDPLVMVVPFAAVLFALGYALQAGIINPFVHRPEHSQFILLVAVALIITNLLLIVFGPDARNVQTSYSLDSFAAGALIVDASKVYAAAATIAIAAALSMPGALIGGVLIGITEALAGLLFTPSAKSMFSFALLVLVLLLRPQGLLGKRA